MIKFFITLFFLLISPVSIYASGLVGSSSQKDTISIPFYVLDSAGNQIDMASSDSLYVVIFSPGGAVVFKDSMAAGDGSISYYDWEDWAGGRDYCYSDRATDLIGSSTSIGIYSYILTVHDISLDLHSTFRGDFQLLSHTLDTSLNYLDVAISSRGTFDYTTNKVFIQDTTASDISDLFNNHPAVTISGTKTTLDALNDFDYSTENVDVNSIGTGAIVAGSIASGALNGKGNWNIGKTGYSISGSKTTLDALNDFNYAAQKVTLVDSSAASISLTVKMVDSLIIFQIFRSGASADMGYSADYDTLKIMDQNGVLWMRWIQRHIGQTPGHYPDSAYVLPE